MSWEVTATTGNRLLGQDYNRPLAARQVPGTYRLRITVEQTTPSGEQLAPQRVELRIRVE